VHGECDLSYLRRQYPIPNQGCTPNDLVGPATGGGGSNLSMFWALGRLTPVPPNRPPSVRIFIAAYTPACQKWTVSLRVSTSAGRSGRFESAENLITKTRKHETERTLNVGFARRTTL
jgi:hypothetical protein